MGRDRDTTRAPAHRTVRTAALLAAALMLAACAKTAPSSSSSTNAPHCTGTTRTATGDLVPHGPRPCLLTSPGTATPRDGQPGTTPTTQAPTTSLRKEPASGKAPAAGKAPAKQPAAPAPAAPKRLR